ncbi:MAG: hypothetical protein Q9M39_00440 [Sulfurovum sp.]|nr:hypothetical protein [Sulfurovum sp.]
MYNTFTHKQKGHKMIKKFLSLFTILLLLASPAAIAEDTQTANPNDFVEDVSTDFGTDSYDEDGCFC